MLNALIIGFTNDGDFSITAVSLRRRRRDLSTTTSNTASTTSINTKTKTPVTAMGMKIGSINIGRLVTGVGWVSTNALVTAVVPDSTTRSAVPVDIVEAGFIVVLVTLVAMLVAVVIAPRGLAVDTCLVI